MEICNQYISDVCNDSAQKKYTIDINHDMASGADLVYNLLHLDLFRSITPAGYNGAKCVAFLTDNISCY